VLVVDDEPRFLRMITFNLENEGYRVTTAGTGEDALALFERSDHSLVLLDVMLPGIDGFEVCRRIREISMRPIIMLTARGAEEEKVKGLQLGADDYVTKPFSAAELVARVQAVLRRAHSADVRSAITSSGDLEIDHLARRVARGGREIRLSPTEYRLLTTLAASPGVALTRDDLLERVWGHAYRGEHEILRVTLWGLRQKLEDDPSNPQFVLTRAGTGYMFAAES